MMQFDSASSLIRRHVGRSNVIPVFRGIAPDAVIALLAKSRYG
jgi:hypothetical protein